MATTTTTTTMLPLTMMEHITKHTNTITTLITSNTIPRKKQQTSEGIMLELTEEASLVRSNSKRMDMRMNNLRQGLKIGMIR